jgi:hypothetical protein
MPEAAGSTNPGSPVEASPRSRARGNRPNQELPVAGRGRRPRPDRHKYDEFDQAWAALISRRHASHASRVGLVPALAHQPAGPASVGQNSVGQNSVGQSSFGLLREWMPALIAGLAIAVMAGAFMSWVPLGH